MITSIDNTQDDWWYQTHFNGRVDQQHFGNQLRPRIANPIVAQMQHAHSRIAFERARHTGNTGIGYLIVT
jgi:hypothetical protein